MKNLIIILIAFGLSACNLDAPKSSSQPSTEKWGHASDCIPAFQMLMTQATSLTVNVSTDANVVTVMGTPDKTGTGSDPTITQYAYSVNAASGSCGIYIFNIKNNVFISSDEVRIYNQ